MWHDCYGAYERPALRYRTVFINVNNNDFLNHTAPNAQGWGYAVFGKVTDSMDVGDAIRKVKTGNSGFHQDVPTEDVVIEKASVLEE